ncbi:MAG: hypothetical protein Rhims3KO_08270 [Hyphomicrobiales bacterium]
MGRSALLASLQMVARGLKPRLRAVRHPTNSAAAAASAEHGVAVVVVVAMVAVGSAGFWVDRSIGDLSYQYGV